MDYKSLNDILFLFFILFALLSHMLRQLLQTIGPQNEKKVKNKKQNKHVCLDDEEQSPTSPQKRKLHLKV